MILSWLRENWPHLATFFSVSAALLASVHTLLLKRDIRAQAGWVAVIWLVPFFGPLLYVVFGVNRIQRRALALRSRIVRYSLPPSIPPKSHEEMQADFDERDAVGRLARLVGTITSRPLVPHNRIRPLVDGDAAYPEMLNAIRGAQSSITLLTYIFDNDEVGLEFAEALGEAKRRGVEVRVLIDSAGIRYSRPNIGKRLRKLGVPVGRFLPLRIPGLRYFNLRNHRKILVVDGRRGFTGGMNIRAGHQLASNPRNPVQDIHFSLEGPIVAQLQEAFAEDWHFTTGEALKSEQWFPKLEPAGSTVARGIVDGPDETMDTLGWVLHGAIASARQRIRILTPYFLPDVGLMEALNVAALRGIDVDIILPSRSNLRFVQWAMQAHVELLMGKGIRIWLSPEPFDHSKLLLVDDYWSLFGSTNWDPRSLRLNFEFNVEAYDQELSKSLGDIFSAKLRECKRLTPEMLDARSRLVRLRDSIARLAQPYL